MKYSLVKPDGTVGRSHDFAGPPPILSASKGRWIPDNPPVFDPDTQKLKVNEPISPAALEVPYQVRALGANQIARIAAMKSAAADLGDMLNDNFSKQFAAMSKQDLNAYIDANVTTQQDTRQYLKKLSRLVLSIIKREIASS